MTGWKNVIIVIAVCATVAFVAGEWSGSTSQEDGSPAKKRVEIVSITDLQISTQTIFQMDGEYNAEKELRNLYRDGWRIEEVIPGTKDGHPAVLVFVNE